MFHRTLSWLFAKGILTAIVTALGTRPAAALMATPKVRYFSGATVPTENSVLADFTQAAFSGYADANITFAGPVNTGLNQQALIGASVVAGNSANPFTGDVLTGYLVYDGNATLYGAERFPSPIPIAGPGDFAAVEVVVPCAGRLSVNA